jgi:PEP-CTERM motif
MKRPILFSAVITLLLVRSGQVSADIITTIDPPGSTATIAYGVSGNNVVGYYKDSNGVGHGFFYNGSTYTTLDVPGTTTGATVATGVSGNNVVGGSGGGSYANGIGFSYTNPTYSILNNVVGYYQPTLGGQTYGFLYNGSTLTTISPGSTYTQAQAVDGHSVVGQYQDAGGLVHGFVYNISTAALTTITLGSTLTAAEAVCGNYVVGEYHSNSETYGFLYNISTSTSVTLGPPGSTFATATGVSGDEVVGTYKVGNQSQGFYVYDILTSTYTEIDPYGSTDTAVNGISGNNIVGWYFDSNGVEHGFEYTIAAVPEPSSFVLLGIVAVIGLAGHCWRRSRPVIA